MTNAKAILQKVLAHTNTSNNSLAKAIGLPRSQNLYDIESGKVKKISAELSEKIVKAFPDINREFLQTGSGEFLKTPDAVDENTDKNMVSDVNRPYTVTQKQSASLDTLIESNRLLAESQRVFAESQKIFAQSQLNFSESNKRVIDTNAVLADLLYSKSTGPGLQSVPLEVLNRLSGLMEYLAELGVELNKWPNKESALAELNKRFYAPQNVNVTTGNPGA